MIKPVRLQRSRRKGARLESPNGLPVVYVGRPSRWANPYAQVDLYKKYLAGDLMDYPKPPSTEEIIKELKGKNLACWCPLDRPCHADVLLEIANGKTDGKESYQIWLISRFRKGKR